MTPTQQQEFLALVRRELGADEVRFGSDAGPEAGNGQDAGGSPGRLACEVPGGRWLHVAFQTPPDDLEARQRRLEMLVSSFESLLAESGTGRPSRPPPPARSLHEELAALAQRASALDALVIDAHSPIVWGAAAEEDLGDEGWTQAHVHAAEEPEELAEVVPLRGRAEEPRPRPEEGEPARMDRKAAANQTARVSLSLVQPEEHLAARALAAARSLPEIETLHKGGHLHHTEAHDDFGYVAHSFASIYVLVLVFGGRFDELRAKRAVIHALPQIEGLVLALPPHDPEPPVAGQMAVRRRRR